MFVASPFIHQIRWTLYGHRDRERMPGREETRGLLISS